MPSNTIDHTDMFMPFMRNVTRCESSLRELNLMWRLIEASAKMNCPQEAHSILPMVAATREGFQRLEGDLVTSLVQESLGKVLSEISTHARHVIDIMVRNLYERTADVGFLATDRQLCRFVACVDNDLGPVLARLREYRSKYTVYDDIMLMDLHGNVLAQIDEDSPVEGSRDPLLAQTLQSHSYVETFRATDLRPGKPHALIYSQRMLHPRTGEPVGVLCLSFSFQEEMQGIFHSRQNENARNIALLLDADNRVIASADPLWVPVGAQVPVHQNRASPVLLHGGRTYLTQTVAAQGYQGYPGPLGWRGQVMVPVELAFVAQPSRAIDRLEPAIAQGLLAHAHTFCPPLYEIVSAADTIRRVVWNGQVMTAGQSGGVQKLKAILEQIGETGARTNEMFSQSIRDLYDTVLSSSMRDSEFLTQLLVDLLDRNLYERANDCRWWAQTPALRALLANRTPDTTGACQLLEHINSLYTVYTRLVVYDRQGHIVAASRPTCQDGSSVLGTSLASDTLAAVLALPSTQSYHVTPWGPSPLDDGKHTCVYHAAIRTPGDDNAVVGGIGIVFNASGEFAAMLHSATAGKPNTVTVFVDRRGEVLASTDPTRPVGQFLALPSDMQALPNGASLARAMVHDGHYCIVGCSASNGYREFKVSDGYRHDVLALSFESFGAVQSGATDAAQRRRTTLVSDVTAPGNQEMATFFVDAGLFALDTQGILEALPASAIATVSVGRLPYCVGAVARKAQGNITGYIWVFDLGHLLRGTPSQATPHSQVIVLEHDDRRIGLLVNELHGVTTFASHRIMQAPALTGYNGQLIDRLIKANQGQVLVQCLDVEKIMALLRRSSDTTAPPLPEPGLDLATPAPRRAA
ncbi:chemotaxis protein CheW [Simplicispira psychrophila]|uniref:chemotaxis protein CheW n=1 Tax=Simplicispira psychrophila TaxID=80882 RepID=UPI0009FE394C|nr:chemotaxis protein CheW [Simplicispira psychrophila]